jgi:hypothetical protein
MSEGTAVRVDPTNVDQLNAWDGDEGAYWVAHADRYDEGSPATVVSSSVRQQSIRPRTS